MEGLPDVFYPFGSLCLVKAELLCTEDDRYGAVGYLSICLLEDMRDALGSPTSTSPGYSTYHAWNIQRHNVANILYRRFTIISSGCKRITFVSLPGIGHETFQTIIECQYFIFHIFTLFQKIAFWVGLG